MEIIPNFTFKGGVLVWSELNGIKSSYSGIPQKGLCDDRGNVYRCCKEEFDGDLPQGFHRVKFFL
jgi:hypothetical protein